jgi:tRNA (guanosine-2'-O-)-methyltransferase
MRALLEPFVTPERSARLDRVFAARLASVTVLLDAPHDPHNGAAVLRSCDAFGVHRVSVLERREPFLASYTVARGAQRWVEVKAARTLEPLVAPLEAQGFELVGTHPEGALSPSELTAIPRLCLVLGNEREGIGPDLRGRCTRFVRVPMRGFVESLNLSVTAALLLSSATDARPGDLSELDRQRAFVRALVLTLPQAPAILSSLGFVVPSSAPHHATTHPSSSAMTRGA